MKKSIVLFVSSVLMAGVFIVNVPAALADDPIIDSPTESAIYQLGEVVGISASVSNPDTQYFDVEVWSDSGFVTGWTWDTAASLSFLRNWTPSTPGSYEIEIYGDLDYGSVSFEVRGPLFRFIRTRPADGTFYPRVIDGFKDKITIEWAVRRDAVTTWYINNSQGQRVRTGTASLDEVGNVMYVRWNGRNGAGNLVAPGRYRFFVKETSGNQEVTSIGMKVATGWVTKTFAIRKSGTQTSSRSTSGPCYIHGSSGVLTLDCWGGTYAIATWGFSIPRDAFNVSRSINTRLSSADICCQGSISKGWTGNKAWVKATGWRAVDVIGTRVTYSRKIRI